MSSLPIFLKIDLPKLIWLLENSRPIASLNRASNSDETKYPEPVPTSSTLIFL